MNESTIISNLVDNILHIQIDNEYTTLAKLNTIELNGLRETIDINTAIISNTLIGKINPSHLTPTVNHIGINRHEDYQYKPSSWLFLSKASGLKRAEPLVVSWCSGNHTTFNIDQHFLSTFCLSPRLANEEIFWDDLKKPIYAVVRSKPLSEYSFPIQTEAYVKVRQTYLEDYLYLRKKQAVQVFTIQKDIIINEEIKYLLKDKDFFIGEYDRQCEIRIRRLSNKDKAHLEINGFKPLFHFKKTTNPSETPTGHYWKGIEGLVTTWRAIHELSFKYIYVSDKVLAIYETDEDYDVYPLSGSVRYMNQWAVSYCERIGRNAIKIEIKKLYEGNSYNIINYWNQFSINPSEIIEGENIALKAERLSKKFFLLGRLLANLLNDFFSFNYTPKDIIGLDENHITYTGWSDFQEFKSIAHHIDLNSFSKEQFISRCKKAYILLVENLQENHLRKVINYLNFPESFTKQFRSLKLLELLFKYLNVVQNTGLNPSSSQIEIIERVNELKIFPLLSKLFALNDIRQLDAHKGGNSKPKLDKALKEFGIEPNLIANNYSEACYIIYDSLIETLDNLNSMLART